MRCKFCHTKHGKNVAVCRRCWTCQVCDVQNIPRVRTCFNCGESVIIEKEGNVNNKNNSGEAEGEVVS